MYTLQVRFPDELRPRLQAAAQAQERSRNWLVVTAVTQYLAQLPPVTPVNIWQTRPAPASEQSHDRQPGA